MRGGYLLSAFGGLFLSVVASVTAHADPCEKAVVTQCVSTSCPAFCEGREDEAACVASCTAKDRCKIALFGAADREDQKALDAQNREQLMVCLEENRADIHADENLGAPILVDEGDGKSKSKSKSKSTKATAEPTPDPQATHGKVTDQSAKSRGWQKVKSPSFAAIVDAPPKAQPKPAPEPPPAPAGKPGKKPKRGKRAGKNK